MYQTVQIRTFYQLVKGSDLLIILHISLKETGESIYWLKLLKNTKLVNCDFDSLLSLAEEIKRMLIASLNTAKENK